MRDENDPIIEALNAFLRGLWRYRLELTIMTTVVIAWFVIGPWLVWPVVILLAIPHTRRPLLRQLRAQNVKRRWEKAEKKTTRDGTPRSKAAKVKEIQVGYELQVKIPHGSSTRDLEKRSQALASSLSRSTTPIRAVRITPSRERADRATAILVSRDPFDDGTPSPWPLRDAEQVSLWNPIPVGVDEHGNPVTVKLIERNMLIGGEPGAGKSVAQAIWAAAAALDPDCRLWILDGKQLDTAIWAPCAYRMVGPHAKQAIQVLTELHTVMEDRRRELLALGAEKIERDHGLPLHFVLIDELAAYLRLEPKDVNEFLRLLLDLISRGRAAGIMVCMATQKPSHELHPQFTALRDLVSYRLAFRTTNWQMSDVILGAGFAKEGWNANTIRHDQKGVGYLHAEGEAPVRIKGHYLTRPEIAGIAQRAASEAADDELSHASTGGLATRLSAVEQRNQQVRAAILLAVPADGNGVTRGELRDRTGRPDQETWPILRSLLDDGTVARYGGGRKGDPYRYRKDTAQD